MNKKIFGITSGGIVAIVLIAVTLNMSLSKPYEETYNPGLVPPPMPVLDVIGGRTVANIQEAADAVGYPVKVPKYLPVEYSIKHIAVDEDTVKILVSKFPVTPATTDHDYVWKDNGIGIYIFEQSADYDKAGEIEQTLTSSRWQPVEINRSKGAGHDIIRAEQDGKIVSSQAELVFYNGNTRIYITGMVPLKELISIAASF